VLKTAIQLLLQDGDLVFDNFRSTIDKILNGDISQKTLKEYEFVKMIHCEQIIDFCSDKNVNLNEQLLYDILEMCLFFGDDFQYCSAQELANLLKIDPCIKKYVSHHITNDGIWAKLKYHIPITSKLDVMAEANRICENS